jgi:beta-lactamase class A
MNAHFPTPHLRPGSILLVLVRSALSQTNLAPPPIQPAARLLSIVDHAISSVLQQFATQNLQPDQIAVTLVDLREPMRLESAGFRGGERIYPASVIKMFYLVAAHRWLEDGRLTDTEELRRALRDMIVDSYNEATGYIVDRLTDTTSGPELSPAELDLWHEKRNAVNRYFAGLGFQNINVNRKTWCEGPYGREQQSVNVSQPNHRNWLTTDAAARLLTEIVTGRAVTPERSRQMLALHERHPFDPVASGQAREYTGAALPPGAQLWSKAGWTSETRHDAAYVELPTGEHFVLVTFTVGHAKEKGIIPAVARAVIEGLRDVK